MDCEEVRDLIPLCAGGEAGEAQREAVERHVAGCGACARELDGFREARAALASLREEEAPRGTWRTLRAGVEAELFPRRAGRLDLLIRCAAVLLLGLSVGLATHFLTASRGPEAPGFHPAAESGYVPDALPVRGLKLRPPDPR